MRMPSQRQHLRPPKELVGLVCRMAIAVPEPLKLPHRPSALFTRNGPVRRAYPIVITALANCLQRGEDAAAGKERPCRPSLSNGFNCGLIQAPRQLRSANTNIQQRMQPPHAVARRCCGQYPTGIYHYAGTRWYGSTKSGAICARAILSTLACGTRRTKSVLTPDCYGLAGAAAGAGAGVDV